MRNRLYFYVLIISVVLLHFCAVTNADEYVDEFQPANPEDVIIINNFWEHRIPQGFVPTSAEIEIRIRVWTFNDYGVVDLFCTDVFPLDYGNVLEAPSKPGFILRINRSKCPNENSYYTLKAPLSPTQLNWLGNDAHLYFALIGDRYQVLGWPAQYYLEYARLTVIGTPGPPQIAVDPTVITNQCVAGEDADMQSFEIWNAGADTMNYSLAVDYAEPGDTEWLSLSGTSGASSGEHDQIDIQFLTADLEAGIYHATISVTSPDAANSPQPIDIELTVTAPSYEGDLDHDMDVDGLDLFEAAQGTTCVGACRIAVFEAFGRCPAMDFQEDFNDGIADNWLNDGSGVWMVDAGEYLMSGAAASLSRHSFYDGIFYDFSYQVDLMRSTGSLNFAQGIIFRSDLTSQNGYYFRIGATNKYQIFKMVDGTLTNLKAWASHWAINTGLNTWNTLKVECSGTNMSFYINDTLVQSLVDTQYTEGYAGVSAYDGSSTTVMHFDNALLMIEQ